MRWEKLCSPQGKEQPSLESQAPSSLIGGGEKELQETLPSELCEWEGGGMMAHGGTGKSHECCPTKGCLGNKEGSLELLLGK
jgi:hypothetical protein